MQLGKVKAVGTLIEAAVRGQLSRAQLLRLCRDNPEVITLALLAAGNRGKPGTVTSFLTIGGGDALSLLDHSHDRRVVRLSNAR